MDTMEETPVKVIRLEETNLYASATKALNTALKTTIGLAIFGGLFCMIGGCFGILFAKRAEVFFKEGDFPAAKKLVRASYECSFGALNCVRHNVNFVSFIILVICIRTMYIH
ncbi:hypothetical protein GBAR_LOCUS3016 [Geodia barretti]|uniref:Uncharacterized protein n=1 Tax=Geodia barretti TaxID=519541 RepID=A0AA35R1Q1_GEOBA|nr:hypothetical protein GBAR_LOCUS3016 [Geodia barretti]